MIMIWPGFEEKWKKIFAKKTHKYEKGSQELCLRLFEEFFSPYYSSVCFKVTHHQIIRTSQVFKKYFYMIKLKYCPFECRI